MKRTGYMLVSLAIMLAAAANAALPHPQGAEFAKGAVLTVNGYAGQSTLENFPVLVRIAERDETAGTGIAGFFYRDVRKAEATDLNDIDIGFTDMQGNGLAYEIDTWDASGESLVWVRLPEMTTGTQFAMFWGSESSGKAMNAENPWSADYAGVWHLGEAGVGGTSTNSTVNGSALDGANTPTTLGVAGKIGVGRQISDSTDTKNKVGGIYVNGSQSCTRFNGVFTISGWFWHRNQDYYYDHLFYKRDASSSNKGGIAIEIKNANEALDVRGSNTSNSDANSVPVSTFKNTWSYLVFVFDGNSACVYQDGGLIPGGAGSYFSKATDNDMYWVFGNDTDGYNGAEGDRSWKGVIDEVRLRGVATSADWQKAEYDSMANAAFLEYGAAQLTGAPNLATPTAVRNADGSFTVSVVVSDVDAVAISCVIGANAFPMTSADASLPKTYSATVSGSVTVSGLASDTTYTYTVVAESADGLTSSASGATALYTGGLSVAKVSDANEAGLVPGAFRITRADTANYLVVAFTLDGTAAEGQTYESVPHVVTIPDGAASVDVAVVPLLDSAVTADATVTLTLASGLYGISSSAGSATLTIVNGAVNAWKAAADGLASVDANWSLGHAPHSDEHVVFDGQLSNAACEWDAAASHTVASWTQFSTFTGTNTLCTTFPGKGDFECLTVTGAMVVDGGFLTHPQSRVMEERHDANWDWLDDLKANETYRIRISAGSLHVGADGVIDARGKGYYVTNNGSRVPGCSHGGRMNADSPPCYGDPREPIHIGMPYHATDNRWNGKGGGAVYVEVSGAAVVDGTIRADAWDGSFGFTGNNYGGAMGAAGSVFLRADTLTGTGRITAMGTGAKEEGIVFENTGYDIKTDSNFKGTGGRVAIATRVPVDRSTFAAISAEGYWMGLPGAGWTARHGGGSGTVVFRDETRQNGLLVIAQQDGAAAPCLERAYPTFWRCPSVTDDGDWTFDAIEFGHRGFLRVPVGTTLNLVGGFASCTGIVSSVDACGGIRYEGGTINVGEGDQTLSGNWMFVPWTNYVFSANVTVTNGAAIGFFPATDVLDDPIVSVPVLSASFEVAGDLLVGADAAIRAIDCGFVSTNETSVLRLGQHSHGGRSIFRGRDASGALLSQAYDSVFAPRMPGSTAGSGLGVGESSKTQRSGGAVHVVVYGTLTLDGEANVSGQPESRINSGGRTGGTGGSIDVTAGRLVGTGAIKANGGNYNDYSGPGGRVAVRLTAPGADFSGFAGSFEAGGGSWWKGGTNAVCDASAGTVYLKTADDGENGGIIRIAMDPVNAGYIKSRIKSNSPANTNTTEMVSLGYGGDSLKDYKNARYEIANYGRAAVNVDFRAQSVTLADATAFLDLEGHTLMLRDFCWVTDPGAVTNKLKSGTYSAAALAGLGAPVEDSSSDGGGRLVIRRGNFVLKLR